MFRKKESDESGHTQFKRISLLTGFKSMAGELAESFLTLYASQLGMAKSLIGLMTGLREVLTYSFQFIWAELSDKIGKRKIFITTGVLGSAVIWLILSLLKDVTWFVFLAAFQGIFFAMSVSTTTAILAQVSNIKSRPKLLAKFFRIRGIFAIIGISLSALLLLKVQINVLFVLAALSLSLGIIAFSHYKEPEFEKDSKVRFLKNLKVIAFDYLSKKELRKFIIPLTIFYTSVYFISGFLSIYIVREIGATRSFFALCVVIYTTLWVFSQKIWARINEKHGRKSVIINSVYISLLALALMAFSRDKYWIIIGYALNGFAWGGLHQAFDALIMDLIPEANRAEYIAFINVLIGFSSLVSPIIGGLIAQYTNIRTILIIGFGIRAISVPLFFRTEEKEKKRFYPVTEEIHRKFLHTIKHTNMFFHRH